MSPEYRNYDNISAIFPTYVNPVSITDEYEFKHEIGRGSYSVVYLAIHTASKMEYAVKVVIYIKIDIKCIFEEIHERGRRMTK